MEVEYNKMKESKTAAAAAANSMREFDQNDMKETSNLL